MDKKFQVLSSNMLLLLNIPYLVFYIQFSPNIYHACHFAGTLSADYRVG